MYGLIAKMMATPGNRDALTNIISAGTKNMPGCVSYVIANCNDDTDGIWITEVWDNKEAHAASHALPAVQSAMTEGRPLIADMKMVANTEPVSC